MHNNEALLTKFYTAFQDKDYKTMQGCYADNATFTDEVFQNLNSPQVRAMWEMLCKTGKDLKLDFKNITANDTTGSAEWTAWYTFSKTGKKVENRIKADFKFQDGKIIQHRDHFSFAKWAGQALGFTGILLGGTDFLKNKVRKTAIQSLEHFMKKQ